MSVVQIRDKIQRLRCDMGQRNENSVRKLKKEAINKREEYRDELLEADDPEWEEVLQQKIQKCTYTIEFCRWQLGDEPYMEL